MVTILLAWLKAKYKYDYVLLLAGIMLFAVTLSIDYVLIVGMLALLGK